MKAYLIFRLYGPMASWGQEAVGGDRNTALCPPRSAILGLLGAALGIKREEQDRLNSLNQSVYVAVKQRVPGSLIRDFHTTQVPSQQKGIVHRTRKNELAETKLNTILSSRDYRCDGLWTIAVSLTDEPLLSLEELKDALKKPVFTLSLGRKSCPLSLPLSPEIIEVNELKSALDFSFPAITRSEKEDALWLGANGRVTYYWEGNKDDIHHPAVQTNYPWNEPVHRERWQFKQHEWHQLSLEEHSYVSI